MPTRQSSTAAVGLYSELAVDNNTDQSFLKDEKFCPGTDFSVNPWWEVYLPGLARITNVTVYNAGDCCGNYLDGFRVLVSNGTRENYSVCAYGPESTVFGKIYNLECLATARIVRIQLYGSSRMLILCEVQVYGQLIKQDELLSRGKKAEQSSTFYSELYKFLAVARFAVDGITKQIWKHKSCSSTKESINPWWWVDLVGLARVTTVTVYNRGYQKGERLSGFHLFVSNNTYAYNTTCAVGPQITKNGQIINLICDTTGRIVGIQLPNKNTKKYLTLCEVKVYGYWIEQDELLSGDMPASQSSTNGNNYAFYAVAKKHIPKKFSCTNEEVHPWWQVHLGGIARVTFLSICSTEHCFRRFLYEFDVLVSNSSRGNFLKCASGPDTPTTDPEINLKCNMTGRIVRIQRSVDQAGIMYFRDVKVYGHWIQRGELLSEGMPASQSSTYYSRAYKFSAVALFAVDSDTNQIWKEKSCSATIPGKNSWWKVYLAGLARVAMVTIYSSKNAEDKLTGFRVLVSESPKLLYNSDAKFSMCASGHDIIIKDGAIHSLVCEADARIVRIELDGSGEERYLTLCEVKVHGYWIKKYRLLSHNRETSQSSIYYSYYYKFYAYPKYAVDGNTDQHWSGLSCSATVNFGFHNWRIYLNNFYHVMFVSIYTGIGEKLPEFDIVVNEPISTKRFTIGKRFERVHIFKAFEKCCSGPPKELNGGEIVGFVCNVIANEVEIQLKIMNFQRYLTLCEVKIYGK